MQLTIAHNTSVKVPTGNMLHVQQNKTALKSTNKCMNIVNLMTNNKIQRLSEFCTKHACTEMPNNNA